LEAPAEQADPAARGHRPGGMPQAQGTGRRCLKCRQPVRLEGPEAAEDEYRKAVHAATGEEACAGGSGDLAAPAGPELARAS
jgi:hypothetical protein